MRAHTKYRTRDQRSNEISKVITEAHTTPSASNSTYWLLVLFQDRCQISPIMSHSDPFSNPPGTAHTKTGDDPAQFSLRPLRILKRLELKHESALDSPARNTSTSSENFVCRPMRLGGVAGATRASESRDSTPRRRLIPQTESKRPSIESTILSKAPSTPTSLPRNSRHVQIKNLPIVQSPRRASVADLSKLDDMIFALCLVDFHHVRGPEVQWWRLNYHTEYDDELFRNLPFQALPDGLHLFEETFSNFNLVYDFQTSSSLDDLNDAKKFRGNPNHLETLFGCLCVRQAKTSDLAPEELARNKDITRSIIQKAVVVISRKQPIFTKIKEKLLIITHTYFDQANFTNTDLLSNLFDNLNESFKLVEQEQIMRPLLSADHPSELQEEFFVNLNLRHILSKCGPKMLVILKALLLEKKVLIYSNNNLELLTQFQNNLIALIPDLINNLELAGSPLSDYTEKYSPLTKPSSLSTNDRLSMLRFFGLPLQVFNTKGLFWNPYLPLQQLDELTADSYMVGCSNLLIANQLAHFAVDVMVNLDTYDVSYPLGHKEELVLLAQDKKFIQGLATDQSGDLYLGSDDYIRYQFEDYIRSLLATTRFEQYVSRFRVPPPGFDVNGNRALGNLKMFNEQFVASWKLTRNFKIWDAICDEFIFNFHEPLHISVSMPSRQAQYNISNFFSSFKKTPPTLMERANEYYSHANKPQKYIPDAEPEDSKKKGWW